MPDESTRCHIRLSGGDHADFLARSGRQFQNFQRPLDIGDVVLSELLEAGHALAGGLRNGASGTCRDTGAQSVNGTPSTGLPKCAKKWRKTTSAMEQRTRHL
jgi:hypothetical protein